MVVYKHCGIHYFIFWKNMDIYFITASYSFQIYFIITSYMKYGWLWCRILDTAIRPCYFRNIVFHVHIRPPNFKVRNQPVLPAAPPHIPHCPRDASAHCAMVCSARDCIHSTAIYPAPVNENLPNNLNINSQLC